MKSDLNRREFAKLTAAALGGVVAGAAASQVALATTTADDNPLLSGKNVCRGLSPSCAGHEKSDKCAGQNSCYTANKHTCHAANDCKGQGGCGDNPGENACKGKGECGVPLNDTAWKKARANFEKVMDTAGKKYGDAPAKS
ncbi:MAG: hypothetical protein N2C12_11670 [Planctomycetales bacterium]